MSFSADVFRKIFRMGNGSKSEEAKSEDLGSFPITSGWRRWFFCSRLVFAGQTNGGILVCDCWSRLRCQLAGFLSRSQVPGHDLSRRCDRLRFRWGWTACQASVHRFDCFFASGVNGGPIPDSCRISSCGYRWRIRFRPTFSKCIPNLDAEEVIPLSLPNSVSWIFGRFPVWFRFQAVLLVCHLRGTRFNSRRERSESPS